MSNNVKVENILTNHFRVDTFTPDIIKKQSFSSLLTFPLTCTGCLKKFSNEELKAKDWIEWLMKHQPCTPKFVSTCPLPHEWSSAALIQLVLTGTPGRVRHTGQSFIQYIQYQEDLQCCTQKLYLPLAYVGIESKGFEKWELTTHLSLSGWHELEDDVFEILKVDFSWVVEVWGVSHRSVGGRGTRVGGWQWVGPNPLLFFCSTFWQPLLPFSFWLRL